jgi:hypothetical protein
MTDRKTGHGKAIGTFFKFFLVNVPENGRKPNQK